VSSAEIPPVAARRAGWFANRPLAVKFAVLLGVVGVACSGVLGSMLVGNSEVRSASAELSNLHRAESLVLQLDTRASELKVDAFKALVRPKPSEQLAELADDIKTPQDMLAELAPIPLTGTPAATVAALADKYKAYTDAITVFIDKAIAHQVATRASWADIQQANDISDGAVGAAKDALAAESAVAEGRLAGAVTRTQDVSLLIAVAGVLLIALVSWKTLRSITGPVGKVRASLEALAAAGWRRRWRRRSPASARCSPG
jgi:methyl-accepting chemotaxis protein